MAETDDTTVSNSVGGKRRKWDIEVQRPDESREDYLKRYRSERSIALGDERRGDKPKKRKLNIVRLVGESDEEYWRRHSREKMRLYRAEAKVGKPPYVAGARKGQRHGKDTLPDEVRAELAQRPGETVQDWLRRYQRSSQARYRARHGEKLGMRRRELYALNGPGEAKIQWRSANADKVLQYSRADFERNREKKLTNLRAWQKANPEKFKAAQIRFRKANPHIFTASTAKIRAKAAQATPLWVDWKAIEKFYRLAKRLTKQTGIEHQVDHIVPLNGKNVRGLHVPWNLQVLTKAENIAKSNKLIPAGIAA